jgi:hypothetical protein
MKILAITFVTALVIFGACSTAPESHVEIVSTARKPLVLVGQQTEQLPTADYVSSVGGASFNGTPPTAPGDIEVTTINGLVQPTAAGWVTVSQISGTSGILDTSNLSTVGSTDWIAAGNVNEGSCGESSPQKISGGKTLGCQNGGIYPWYAANTPQAQSTGTCTSCSFLLTFDNADSTSALPSSTNPPYRFIQFATGSTADFGWVFNAPALTTTQVLRVWWLANNITAAHCVGVLSDGSGTATSPNVSSGGTASAFIKDTWTFKAATVGARLTVVCHTGTTTTGGPPVALWFAEALSPT